VADLLAAETSIFSSKGEARKMISGGGVSVNREKLTDAAQILNAESLISGKYLVAQKGKKNYFLIKAS
jgi:tyrosyl-tRNA synthetase